jgi:Aerotolerance regulator N-terminal
METLTFFNAPLLWGLALASIPIIIHLLFRRQFRRVDWAPMRYLKLSMQRNRRRIRIEQWLLLLLRTALVLLLFFLVARPVMHAEGLSRLLGASGRTNRIVVLDDSLSAGYTQQGTTALARGQQVLADLLPTFAAKDAFTLLLASAPAAPLLREVELDNVDDVVTIIRGTKPTEVLGSWKSILDSVDDLVTSGSYPIYEVTLVTDLRKAGWDERLDELGSRWAAARVRLRIFDVGIDDAENVALASLAQTDRVALVGVPVRFEAEIKNDSSAAVNGLEANFIVDGKPSLVRLPDVAAGETVKLPLTATFQEPGQHDVALELAEDALPGDNRRTVVVDARSTISVELVDGEPSTEPLGGETDFLALALSLAGDAADAFRVEVLTDSAWASTPPGNPDVLVLAGVAHLTAEQVEIIERQVAAGMGLAIFVGDQIDPDNYNQLLYKGGRGLLPAELAGISDVEFAGLLVEAGDGSPLDAIKQLTPAVLERIKMRKTYELEPSSVKAEGVRVLARWNNPAAAPAVVQKVYGRGSVLLWTTSADRSWSDWPTEPSYVLAVREATLAIARTDAGARAFTAGQTLRVSVPASRSISQPAIEVPYGTEPEPLVVASDPPAGPTQPQRKESHLSYGDTRRAGLYKMTWRDSVAGNVSQQFAVNPHRRESDLTRIGGEELSGLWGALAPEVITLGREGDTSLAVRGREIWRTLAVCLMGLLVVESCFARWAGRQR